MPNLTSVVTNYFPTSSETYSNNINASITAGAATVPVNAASTYTDGDIVILTVDPGLSAQATFIGVKASTPDRFINCFWTEGNVAVGHSNGAVITDYDSSTHQAVVTKGIRAFANNDGTLKTTAVQAALGLGAASLNGWNALGYAPTSVTHLGNRNYSVVINGVDLTGTLSAGMRLRSTRTVIAPNQVTSLNGTTQYWSRTAAINGMTFTDDFAISIWVKLNAYTTATTGTLVSRYNGVSGYALDVTANGTVVLRGKNAGAGNESNINSYAALPLNRWVHIVAQLDMSSFSNTPTTSYILLDGIDAPSAVNRIGTLPTALIQAGNIEIGAQNGGTLPWGGKIAQVGIFNAKITQAVGAAIYAQGLLGTETSLISAYSFSGNGNDLNTTNVNHLTAQNGATATNADAPFGQQGDGSTISTTLDYGIIMQATFSTNTTLIVNCPEGNTFSTSGISALAYSSNAAPYGMPKGEAKWTLSFINSSDAIKVGATSGVYYSDTSIHVAAAGYRVQMPIGAWNMGYKWTGHAATGAGSFQAVEAALTTSLTIASDEELDSFSQSGAGITLHRPTLTASKPIAVSVATTWYLITKTSNSADVGLSGVSAQKNYTYLKNAYL